jgi:hypothetical protein
MNERRESRRLFVPQERQMLVLMIDGKLVKGRLADLSASGFSVEIADAVDIEAGAQIEMRSCDGTHLVQVVHVCQAGGTTCLGLARLHDIALPEARVRTGRARRATNLLFLVPVLVASAIATGTVLTAVKGPEWMSKTIVRPVTQALFQNANSEPEQRPRPRPQGHLALTSEMRSLDDDRTHLDETDGPLPAVSESPPVLSHGSPTDLRQSE